jgi:hypothetical protein
MSVVKLPCQGGPKTDGEVFSGSFESHTGGIQRGASGFASLANQDAVVGIDDRLLSGIWGNHSVILNSVCLTFLTLFYLVPEMRVADIAKFEV